jgi:hypothetical protein
MELVSFETLTEVNAFMSMSKRNESSTAHIWYHIDGMTLTPFSPTDWYWTNSGNKVSFLMPWAYNQPDFYGGTEYCLSIFPNEGFNDIPCDSSVESFFCQRLDYFLQL